MSDWTEATDPVPARRELTPEEAAKNARYWAMVRKRQAGAPRPDVPSAYAIEPDFEDMGA